VGVYPNRVQAKTILREAGFLLVPRVEIQGSQVQIQGVERLTCGRDSGMICRICGSSDVHKVGEVKYYVDLSHVIYTCRNCRSHFTEHTDVAETLHANTESGYGVYLELSRKVKKLFDERDAFRLERELSAASKYSFIIKAVAPYPKSARILEVGCSRGYLTSYFILAGRDIIGADVSKSAIEAANLDFGNCFFPIDDPIIAQRAPYDLIYHTGTIGCVSDPVGLTRSLLQMLKPGGKLVFNAPNANALWLRKQLWIDFAPPPDVVTLFTPGFWTRAFSKEASVGENVENCSIEDSFVIGFRKLMRRWRPTRAGLFRTSLTHYKYGPSRSVFDNLWGLAERIALKVAIRSGAICYAPLQPTPYGLYVTLTKRD
jgi:SAM-dependent methyltransferase